MKLIFELYLVFSLLLLAQQNSFTQFQTNNAPASAEAEEHDHTHSLLASLEAIMLGSVEHDHGHEENGQDWPISHSHDGRNHTHFEHQNIKFDVASAKSFFPFSDHTAQVIMPEQLHQQYHTDYIAEIFRPPIQA